MNSSPEPISRQVTLEGLPAPTGPYAWTVTCGGMIFVSGLRGIDRDSGEPVAGDSERVRQIFLHLQAILDAHGCRSSDVLATRVYVTDMVRLRPLVNDGYESFFGADLPTRTIVEVRRLNQDDSVEIEVVIARRQHEQDAEAAVTQQPRGAGR